MKAATNVAVEQTDEGAQRAETASATLARMREGVARSTEPAQRIAEATESARQPRRPPGRRRPVLATRADLERAGCDLIEPADGRRAFLVETYARDTGAVLSVLAVPVHALGQRWGAVCLAWDPEQG